MADWHRKLHVALALTTLIAFACGARVASASDDPAHFDLQKNWQLQSSCETQSTGAQISTVGFDAAKWHHANSPSTVVAALVADKTYPDPTYGTNLRSLPGFVDDRQHFFSNTDMPEGSPFRCSWWYRTEFTPPADYAQRTAWLHLLGINYRANVWLNGQKIADAKDVAGTYATFEFNVTKF